MQDSLMAKSYGTMPLDLKSGTLASSFSRQSTFLQDNGRQIKVLESNSENTMSMSWSPVNHMLAFGGDNNHASLWNIDESVDQAQSIQVLPHTSQSISNMDYDSNMKFISAIDWKCDGSAFVTAAYDGICRMWDDSGELSKIMYNHISMPLKTNKNLSSDGIQSNGISDSANKVITQEDFDSIYSCKWNKDGSALVTVSEKNNVILWTQDGEMGQVFDGHTTPVVGLDWKNKNVFATSSQDGTIKIWDVQNKTATTTFNAHSNNIK